MKNILLIILCIVWNQALAAQSIYYLPGSTQKIDQLVGDFDREKQISVANPTDANYQIWGTDLGIPFTHQGKTYLLFGDIPVDVGFGKDRDPIAFTEDTDPSDGLDLQFITSAPGLYKPITITGISQGAFEVPLDGISLENTMYIYHSTDGMNRSVLAKSMDDGQSFTLVEENISVDHFINISINKINRTEYPNLPGNFEDGLVILGTGAYRESAIYLYSQAQNSIENNQSRYFFAGWDGDLPIWSSNETDAIPVIDIDCGGELSTAYNPYLEKWMVLYNCGTPRGIQCHFSDQPWGPYTEAITILEPWNDDAYCHYIHTSWDFMECDEVHDPGRENEWGGEYGPYLFKEMSTMDDSLVTIYYTLSTWNPYTSILMKSTFVKQSAVHTEDSSLTNNNIQYSPNPTTGIVYLTWPEGNFQQADLYHSSGQFITTLPLSNKSSQSAQIDLSNYPTGVYLVKIRYKEYHKTLKVVRMD
ncbi:MAG: DUF4185 domain-containing protein [Saprospiraceae bacterium]|nr:DUF4185 domain-containing protein [Saprospiraceae bacterium]